MGRAPRSARLCLLLIGRSLRDSVKRYRIPRARQLANNNFRAPPLPQWGGLDLGRGKSGFACLGGSKVPPPLGVVEEEVVVLIVLVRRHRHAVGTAVRRAVDDEDFTGSLAS
jgi:hypothetical protein